MNIKYIFVIYLMMTTLRTIILQRLLLKSPYRTGRIFYPLEFYNIIPDDLIEEILFLYGQTMFFSHADFVNATIIINNSKWETKLAEGYELNPFKCISSSLFELEKIDDFEFNHVLDQYLNLLPKLIPSPSNQYFLYESFELIIGEALRRRLPEFSIGLFWTKCNDFINTLLIFDAVIKLNVRKLIKMKISADYHRYPHLIHNWDRLYGYAELNELEIRFKNKFIYLYFDDIRTLFNHVVPVNLW